MLESALRQSNIEKLQLEKRLLSSGSSMNSTTTTTANVGVSYQNRAEMIYQAGRVTPFACHRYSTYFRATEKKRKIQVYRIERGEHRKRGHPSSSFINVSSLE